MPRKASPQPVSKPSKVRKPKAPPPAAPSVHALPAIHPDTDGCVNTQEAATLLGVTPRTLTDWRSKGCTGVKAGGRVDLGAVMEWREAKIKADADDRLALIKAIEGGMTEEQVKVERELTLLKIDQIKLAKALELLLDRSTFIHSLSVVFGDVTSRLRSMPAELGAKIAIETDPRACSDMLSESIEKTLMELNVDRVMNAGKPAEDEDEGTG